MKTPDIEDLLKAKEGENVEFKEAQNRYSFEDLAKHCCALANEGGGQMVLGVTNKRPRSVVGTAAFEPPENTRRGLGGLPPDVTLENILDRQSPRNRRIADIFAKCGLVERSGQGMNLMFELSIKSAKHLPDLKGTDRHHVVLTLDGQVQDPKLLEMMAKIGQETLESFSTHDFLVVNRVHREQAIPESLRDRVPRLLDLGVLERAARGRYMLGRRFYRMTGRRGVYTRKRGLDRETQKALLLKHIRDNEASGSKLAELCEVLPGHNRSQIQVFLRELRREGKIRLTGATAGARWFPAEKKTE